MCDPVLDFGSLDVQEETQHLTIGLCHGIDLIVETPVDLPLRKEQLCPFVFTVEYLRGISHELMSPCGWSWSGSHGSTRWSATAPPPPGGPPAPPGGPPPIPPPLPEGLPPPPPLLQPMVGACVICVVVVVAMMAVIEGMRALLLRGRGIDGGRSSVLNS